ncbi:hypothetical protein, variant [Puccinia triticina 1-1 BBBD Race 1]|uniref:Nucleoporin POM152 n=2 Tax=Puccinia triticina TaxID=208348 RepID=A0A180H324_PUCT1|nr:uncharacterized protein PtA15_8A663 [Puccinia triticina]OAV99399.1 hypothetical protein PTTG_25367 [Puccinia triticina 1-1 BBBD Race 1]OAV99400.1 hypothetical protein, variant [Puccinia triticina 1-1 BBBD Race 1]WAQ87757.1 hypothetical protein PtA15_8A663 [Puccinia triticina]WAR57636.1 hypothetical protein PtB15_8B689 [Puccinia triticina]
MAERPPLITPTFCDLPTQRLYVVSSFILIQAYKLIQFLDVIWSGSINERRRLWVYWSFIDAFLIGFLIPFLRIPRLRYNIIQRSLIISSLVFVNWLFVGNWHLQFGFLWAILPRSIKNLFNYQTAIMEYKVRLNDVISPSSHILGKHTIHILPHSTAKLNPSSQCFCLSAAVRSAFVSIPILFNNSIPHLLQYSVMNFTTGEKSLRNVTHAQLQPLTKQKNPQKSLEDWLEDEEGDLPLNNDNQAQSNQNSRSRPQQSISSGELKLSPTQHLYNLDINNIGVIRLERVLDKENMDIRIARTEALVVECPRASFAIDPAASSEKKFTPWPSATGSKEDHKCIGDTENFGLVVKGLAPLSLTYQQIVNGQRKLVKLEGITSGEFFTPLTSIDTSTLAEKLSISNRPEYTWAESHSIEIPLNVSLTTPGQHTYQLDSLKDACGHRFDFEKVREASSMFARQEYIDSKSVKVHSRGQISFIDCGNTDDEPLRLLQGKSVSLRMAIQQQSDMPDPPWKVGISYQPSKSSTLSGTKPPSAWMKELTFNDREQTFSAREAGVYEIVSLQGKYCQGDMLVPSICSVIEQPTPTIDLNFTSITDKCSGEIGLQANFLLTGKPPFKLHYLISQVGRQPQAKVKVVQHSRDELLIQPDSPGQFEYSFIRLDDQYYQGVEIVGKTIKQTVHPLAHARFVRGGKDENIWSCSGESVEAHIELRGAPPYSVAYQILGEEPKVIGGISTSYATLDIAIPQRYIKKGGSFIVTLISITDGNGCLRNLTVSDLNIEVHRTKPTLKFYGSENERKIVAREGDMVGFPMRLTGNGPWTIEYIHNDSNRPITKVVHGSNDDLLVDRAGKYTLTSVHDRHCPGTVENPTFYLEWIPKPSLMISPHNSGDLIRGVWIKPAVCEMSDDSIELSLEGTPPFSVNYSVLRKPLGRGEKAVQQSKTIQILKASGTLPMQTLEPGQYVYTIHSLNDHIYNTPSSSGLLNSQRSGDIQLQQEVLASPQGLLNILPRTTYCVEESLSAQANKGVKIELTGKAPFQVEIEVKNQATQISENFKLQLESKSSLLDLPYKFSSASPHSIKIKSLEDSSKCKSIAPSIGTLSDSFKQNDSRSPVTIEVAEIASIKPINNKPYYCVGENLEFLLKGSPPWLIKYEFNGHQSKINVNSQSQSKFSRLAQEPGLFKLLEISSSSSASSIASGGHNSHNDICNSRLNFERAIKPLPVVKISSGRYFIEDIREGDQSEITFTFEGTPPFAFTYVRTVSDDSGSSASSSKKSNENAKIKKSGGSGERILESKTITDIYEYSYSIFTKQEGTWSVTFIQDAFCSFPPFSKE